MSTTARVLGFVAVLVLVLVAGFGLGRWVGPDVGGDVGDHHEQTERRHDHER